MDKNLRLSLDLLRGFRAAARHLSFTRAAADLFVTQSAISREIKKLEQQIGQPLFHRVNRALQLTHAGEDLYRATDEALGLIDAATERLAGTGRTLGVTTTTALASLWLVPRLPQFTRRHPGIDVRIAATNELFNLEREHLDVAIRYVPPGWDIPSGVRLVDYEIFPVCSPALARDKTRPLRKRPHLTRHLRDGVLCAPFGREYVARLGGFDIVVADGAARPETVEAFIAWLRSEVQQDEERTAEPSRMVRRAAHRRAV